VSLTELLLTFSRHDSFGLSSDQGILS